MSKPFTSPKTSISVVSRASVVVAARSRQLFLPGGWEFVRLGLRQSHARNCFEQCHVTDDIGMLWFDFNFHGSGCVSCLIQFPERWRPEGALMEQRWLEALSFNGNFVG